MPNILPNIMPPELFDGVINQYGHRTLWLKNHFCPCTGSVNSMTGQPDSGCQTCEGRGYYWDVPIGPFMAKFIFTQVNFWNEPGVQKDEDFGLVQQMNAAITIPFDTTQVIDPTNNGFPIATGIPAGQIWNDASLFDAYIQIDVVDRLQTTLYAGKQQVIPFQHNLTIAPTGAVTTYDPVGHQVITMSGYTVNGAQVIPPVNTPFDQAYTVEFNASPIYVAWNRGGSLPFNRPAGGGQANYPKRFHIQTLDTWLRARQAASATGLM